MLNGRASLQVVDGYTKRTFSLEGGSLGGRTYGLRKGSSRRGGLLLREVGFWGRKGGGPKREGVWREVEGRDLVCDSAKKTSTCLPGEKGEGGKKKGVGIVSVPRNFLRGGKERGIGPKGEEKSF